MTKSHSFAAEPHNSRPSKLRLRGGCALLVALAALFGCRRDRPPSPPCPDCPPCPLPHVELAAITSRTLTETTKLVSYTIEGTGSTCKLKLAGVDQNLEASVRVTDDRYVRLVFTRSPAPMMYFHFDDGLTHWLQSSAPPNGTATTVSGTFDIPEATGIHVDHAIWTVDTPTPPCQIAVTIKRE